MAKMSNLLDKEMGWNNVKKCIDLKGNANQM